MSDIESDSDNEGEFVASPKPFEAPNANHIQALMNTAASDQASKPNTSQNDAAIGDKMAPRVVANTRYKMAAEIAARTKIAVAYHPTWTTADILAIRKAAIDAHNMASKDVANNGAKHLERIVEISDDPMVAPPAAVAGDGAPTPANVFGNAIPPQIGDAVRGTTTLKGVASGGNKMAVGARYKMAAGDNMAAGAGYNMAAVAGDNMEAVPGENMATAAGYKMVAGDGYKAAGAGGNMAAGTGNKMAAGAGNKVAAGAGQKMAPAPRCSQTVAPFEVRLGPQGIRWIQEGSLLLTHRTSHVCQRPAIVLRPGLWRITLQALLCMLLAVFLTYFALHFIERYLPPVH